MERGDLGIGVSEPPVRSDTAYCRITLTLVISLLIYLI